MTFNPTPFRDDGRPQNKDWWNILLFVILTFVIGYGFEIFIMKPRQERLAAHQEQIAQQQQKMITEGTVQMTPAPRPVADVIGAGTRVMIENDHIMAHIPLHRGRIDDVMLKDYFTALDKKENIHLFTPNGTENPFYNEIGWLSDDAGVKVPGADTTWTVQNQKQDQVTLSWNNGQGMVFTRTFALDDQYMFTVTDIVQNKSGRAVTLTPYALLTQHGVPKDHQTGIVHEGAVGYITDQYVAKGYGSWADLAQGGETYQGSRGWIGMTSRYFFAGLVPDQQTNTTYRITYRPVQNTADTYGQPRYQVDTMGAPLTAENGEDIQSTMHVFTGAKKLRVLDSYEEKLNLPHFDLAMDFGWFYFLTKPFYYIMVWINDYVGNFGLAILILTAMLRFAVFPLANTSFKSFAKMKKVAPQIQELQKKYVSDKQKMQEELVKLYQKEKVNPLSGCLPILAQIPIFFAMYKVISVAIEMRHAPFFGWIKDLSAPDPTSILNLFGLLPYDVHSFFHFGIWPTLLLVMIMLQVRMSPPPTDAFMRIFFSYYYPLVVCFIMSKFAAGLVIYWSFSAFLSIVQQMVIMRSMGVPIHLFERFKKDGDKQDKETTPEKEASSS